MNTNRRTPTLVRTSVMIRAETDQALRELADRRSEGKVAREIRRALEEFVERETKAAA